MKLKHYLVDFWDRTILLRESVVKVLDKAIFYVLFLGFALALYEIGFPKEDSVTIYVMTILRQIPKVAMLLYLLKWFLQSFIRKNPKIFDRNYLPELLYFCILFFFNQLKKNTEIFGSEWFLYIVVCVFFVVRVMRAGSVQKGKSLTPSLLFIVSFVMLIFVGTALLLIPDATTHQMSLVDALFTATSAVCVTGLSVVDTSTAFTDIGKDLLLVLIQVGGLGLMTFTNFFAILFKGGMSFRNHLILSDIIQTDKPNTLFSTLMKIVIYSAIIELIGAFFIHMTADISYFNTQGEGWMFSIFHAISAFCNAGFSTLPDGLFNIEFRYNYNFQLVICFLVILGGIGFPVVNDIYESLKNLFNSLFRWLFFRERFVFMARNLNVHSKLVLSSYSVLLGLGMLLYFITEYNNVLTTHPTAYGKAVQSFFGSVTPRTAGFNTVDMGSLMQGTILTYLLLMWIGASPSSTGGGIKVTTIVIALSNVMSLARGKERVDLFRREISLNSIRRAFAVMFLSVVIIGMAVFLISIFDPGQDLTHIAFECFSAYSTVGLSLNLTPQLGTASKMVLIATMFIGRVGMFTIVMSLIKKMDTNTHQYPKENVLIL